MSQGFMQQPMQAEAPQQAQQDLDIFDEAAFERAFDMAREQIMSEEATALPDQAKEQAQSRTLDPYPHCRRTRHPESVMSTNSRSAFTPDGHVQSISGPHRGKYAQIRSSFYPPRKAQHSTDRLQAMVFVRTHVEVTG